MQIGDLQLQQIFFFFLQLSQKFVGIASFLLSNYTSVTNTKSAVGCRLTVISSSDSTYFDLYSVVYFVNCC